ncbi:MAG: LysE family transporter [Candidatus Peregrinibacteria bacterium]
MENFTLIATVTVIHFLGLISPGPDLIMAVKNSVSYSRKIGVFTAIGFGLGISVHIFYCLAGLALLISQSIVIFNIIKLLGAAYLMYIGFQAFFSKSTLVDVHAKQVKNAITPFQAVKMGFLTNLLNPKVTLFFLSLFTLVLSPNTPTPILVITSVIMILNTVLWFSFMAVLFTQEKVKSAFNKSYGIFNKILGGMLMALGTRVALSE